MFRLDIIVISLALQGVYCQSTTRSWNHASPTTPAQFVSQCSCTDYNNIWLDIMVIIDQSESMTEHGIQEATNYLLTGFLQVNVGQGIGHFSRIGAVTYADDAVLLYPITAFNSSDDLLNNFNPQITNAGGSNIEAAIRIAQDQFNSEGHRPNVKKVIVLLASHYESGSWEDPTEISTQFKENGGIIITIEYVQTHGAEVPILSNLASKCYSLSNKNESLHVDDLLEMLCRANCFCQSNWEAYSTSQCNEPNGGCYYPVLIPATELLAKITCNRTQTGMERKAMLTKIEDASKAVFVNSLFTNKDEFTWIGLEYNKYSFSFVWEDGTSVGSYQPFSKKNFSLPCVSQKPSNGFNSQWYSEICNADHMYTCQAMPCSADNYCSVLN